MDLRSDYAAVQLREAPGAPCPACGGAATFDDGPRFFDFVASLPQPRVPAWAGSALETTTRSPRGLRVEQHTTDALTAVWLDGVPNERTRTARVANGLEGRVVLDFGGVTSVPGEATAAIAPLFGALRRERGFVSRLRPQVLAPVARAARSALLGRVVDFLLPAHCRRCDEEVEARIGLTEVLAADDAPVRCPACGSDAELLVERQGLRPLVRFLCDDVDDEVTSYLDAHPDGPRPPDAAGPRYEVLRPIGFGGMAEVCLAKQRGPAGFVRSVALKRILPEYTHDRSFVRMFLREARVAARVTHPNVVQIYDVGRDQGRYFIAMELVRGCDLSSVLRAAAAAEVPIPLDVACLITTELLKGLEAAHTSVDDKGGVAPILHRDVSPQNVLVSHAGEVKLTDFGVAKAADLTSFSQPGSVKGKIYYVAPERIDARLGAVDGRSDLFAAGLLLYELLTGFAPFRRKDNIAAMRAVLDAVVPDLAERRADIPREIIDVIDRAMARRPGDRYATATEMSAALQGALTRVGRRRADAAALAAFVDHVTSEARALGQGVGPVLASRGSLASSGEVGAALADLSLSLSIVLDENAAAVSGW